MPYCTIDDITLGSNMTPPRGLDVPLLIQQKADDIDAVVGRIYSLPIQFSMTDPEQKPWALMFRKCNAYLVMGEVYLLAAGPRQDDSIVAIANQYLRQANAFLNSIENRKLRIPFLEEVNPDVADNVPVVVNRDSFSRVEEFHNPTLPGVAPWVGTRSGGGLPWE